MSEKLSSLRKRLAKVERKMADIVRREELANCNCKQSSDFTVLSDDGAEEFEAEMNLPCPAHGFRRLGRIMHVAVEDESCPRSDELIATYEARLEQADREQAQDPEEYDSDES